MPESHRRPTNRSVLAVLGNLVVDDVVYEDGRTEMGQAGGAAVYVALGAALWWRRVAIVSRVGDDYPKWLLEALEKRRIDLSRIGRLPGGTLRTWLLYEGRRRRVVHRLEGPTHEQASPRASDLPDGWDCAAIHLAPMPLDLQRRLIARLSGRQGALLSADPYELLEEGNLDRWRETFAACDLLFFGEDELLIEGALDAPAPILERLCRSGDGRSARLARVVLKRGARGGMAYDRDRRGVTEWVGRADRLVDSTGAGDAFAGGVLAGLLRGDPLEGALERGVVSASFALAGQGPRGLLAAGPETAESRRADWFGTRGEEIA